MWLHVIECSPISCSSMVWPNIASEYVSVDDAVGMARLCVETAKAGETDALAELRTRLEKRLTEHRRFFRKLSP